jgi:hypothetical protein
MKHSIGSGRNRFWSNAKSVDKNQQISPLNTPFVISNTVDMKQVLIICGTIFFGFGSTGYFIHTQLKSNYAETKKDNENRDASFEKRYTESKEIQEKRYTESKEYNNKRDADFDKKYSEFKEFNERRYTESKEYDRKRDADLDKKYTEFTDLVKNKLR